MSQLMSWKPKKQWVLPLLTKGKSQRLAVLQEAWRKLFCPSILKRRAQRVLLHFQDLNKEAKSRPLITHSMPTDIFSNYATEQTQEERAVLWRSCFTLMIKIWNLGALAVQASNCSKDHCIKNPNVNYVKWAIHFRS